MSFALDKIRVGVLRGGPSPEYEVSLNTGKTILANLPEKYQPLDIFISKEGVWHTGGLQRDPYSILKTIDVAVNALHGAYGEDGTVQKLLEHFNIPYTGSDSIASALGIDKVMSKNIFRQAGLKVPHHIIIERKDEEEITNEMANKINENIIFPIIVKPVNSGSSIGISFADNARQTKDALKESFKHSSKLLIEEYLGGKEATCGVIEDFRGKDIYTTLPVEIAMTPPPSPSPCQEEGLGRGRVFDYNSKYKNLESRYKIPGNFTDDEKRQIREAAALVHKILGLRHYSRSDFVLHPKRGLFVLEVNSLPELSHRSSFIKSLEAAGGSIKEFLSHILSKTLEKK